MLSVAEILPEFQFYYVPEKCANQSIPSFEISQSNEPDLTYDGEVREASQILKWMQSTTNKSTVDLSYDQVRSLFEMENISVILWDHPNAGKENYF